MLVYNVCVVRLNLFIIPLGIFIRICSMTVSLPGYILRYCSCDENEPRHDKTARSSAKDKDGPLTNFACAISFCKFRIFLSESQRKVLAIERKETA